MEMKKILESVRIKKLEGKKPWVIKEYSHIDSDSTVEVATDTFDRGGFYTAEIPLEESILGMRFRITYPKYMGKDSVEVIMDYHEEEYILDDAKEYLGKLLDNYSIKKSCKIEGFIQYIGSYTIGDYYNHCDAEEEFVKFIDCEMEM